MTCEFSNLFVCAPLSPNFYSPTTLHSIVLYLSARPSFKIARWHRSRTNWWDRWSRTEQESIAKC